MKTGLVALVIVLSFALGVAASSVVKEIGWTFGGDISVECISRDACVGQAVDDFLLRYNDDMGGLTSVACYAIDPEDPARPMGEYIFLPAIVQGKTCPSANYVLDFRNPSTRTSVIVKEGSVTEIVKGQLHTLDL